MNEFTYISPLGDILIEYTSAHITRVQFDAAQVKDYADNDIIKQCISQLDAYFAGKLHDFDLPLAPQGTDFQKKVWTALQYIPYGKTCSYGQIAATIGKPRASRAVGGANNKNPIHIIIPCHRVIGASGVMTGYAGGIHRKAALLELESKL